MRRMRVELADGQLTGVAFGDPVRDVDALFLHANGFNAMTYQSLLAPLAARAHIAGLDLRGHGLSTATANPGKLSGWNVFRDDVITALEQLAPNGTLMAGHSMGATISLLVAAKRPDLVKGLVLADPVLMPPEVYRNYHLPVVSEAMQASSKIAAGARKRRNEFESPEAALENFSEKPIFKHWREPFLQDYLLDGLTKAESGTWHLSCDPRWEAACFRGQRHRPWQAVRKVKCPIVVILAEKGSTCPPKSVAKLMRMKPSAFITTAQGTSHFLVMERPYSVRDPISDFLSKYVEGFEMGEEGRVQRNLSAGIGQKD